MKNYTFTVEQVEDIASKGVDPFKIAALKRLWSYNLKKMRQPIIGNTHVQI